MAADLLITNIKGLVQVRDATPRFLSGIEMAELPLIENSFLQIEGEKISGFGEMNELPSVGAHQTIDAAGGYVFPSFVDSHTHLVFASSREEEFVMKIKGRTYEEIAARGGGILNSARKLREMSEDELFECSIFRAREIMGLGTGRRRN